MTKNDVHVIPLNDYREHDQSRDCWCCPTVNDDGLVIHHAMDGRERYESGEMLLQ
ncbi:hypothetical protein [Neisseria shayeganii]|uniref:Uncharacterized protein n=2 Tax=Neisseria shayeganii TaxID=607712 RepID=G4CG89_9NEIS|nr:hypothetical protein [Neisseria shayeganii]EGY53137.1 hypothetical protein HMPREF9371_0628 [Neisseria shayeganii 871]QMT41251.1 hypothetical protein H3L94_04275 [Neisseria shayeganii]